MLKSIINPDLSGKLTKLIFTFLFFIFLSTNLFAQVTQEWASRFDLIFEWDEANSIAVDNTGNVYVTGKSAADPDWYFITIKYNSAGGRQWFKMYGGWGLAIAVDESGNSYVTSENVIIKFNSGGGQQWISSYGGEDIVVDDFGNVYVTGGGYTTVKYNSGGDTLWLRSYNGFSAYSIAVDGQGNVYVTGQSNYDIATVKYNSSGVQQWASIYDGPEHGWDLAKSITVDNSGNVYVTGESFGGSSRIYATIKYNSNGDTLWVRRYNGPGSSDRGNAIVVDDSGNVYVTGGSSQNWGVTIKYNALGVLQWIDINNGIGNDIAMDDFGNLYVAGCKEGFTTTKYNTYGVRQWIMIYAGPATGAGEANSIALDSLGNVYVTGLNYGGTYYNYDYVTIKYSQQPPTIPAAPLLISPINNAIGQTLNLSLVWNSVYGADTYRLQFATDSTFINIILDDSTLIDTMMAVTNLSPLTDYYWRVNAKNIIGTGPFSSIWHFKTHGSPTQVNLLYPPDDTTNIPVNVNFIWSKPGEQTYSIRTLKQNLLDNRVISKYWFELTTDTSGTPLIIDSTLTDTTKLVNGLNNLTSYYWRVRAKNEIGWGEYSEWFKFATIISAPLAPVLVSPANGALLVETNPLLDWDSSATAENYKIQVSTDSLFTSTVYDSSGITITEFQIPNNGLNINTTYYWRVNARNAGGTSSYSTIFHFTTGATNITHNNEIPKEFKLYNSYPNPFNPSTKIKFDIPKASYVKLIVYDVLGREIKTLVNEKLNAGRYEVSWPAPTGDGSSYPSGVYFYRLTTADFVDVKKMLFVK